MRTPIALSLAAGAVLAAATTASAHQPVLFSQTARTGTVIPLSGHRADVVLHTAHRPLVVFEERPGTRTGTVPERAFTGLWRATFKEDAPNAVLTGAGPGGRDRRAIVRITGATQVTAGVRYRVQVLRGTLPATMHPANLMIDSVPLSAITAYLQGNSRRIGNYEPLINALSFPMATPVATQQQVEVTPGNPFTVAAASPTVLDLGALVMQPASQVDITGSPGTVVMNFHAPAGDGCWPMQGLLFRLDVTGSDGSSSTLLPSTPGSGVDQQVTMAGGNQCLVSWRLPGAPAARTTTTYVRLPTGQMAPFTTTVTYQTTAVLSLPADSPGPLTLAPLQLSTG